MAVMHAADGVADVLVPQMGPFLQQRAAFGTSNGGKPATLFCDRDSDVELAVRNELDVLVERHPRL